MNTTHAPYTFIPFAERPLRRYNSPAELPSHGTWNPELLTGEIRLTITAQTPIYIGNGKQSDEDEREKTNEDFFRDAEGDYAIPGSSLRGLVRENMQILGFGLLRPDEDFQDYYLLYRRIADAKGTLGKELSTFYRNALKRYKDGKKVTNVFPGILSFDGDKYHITTLGKYLTLRAHRRNGSLGRFRRRCGSPVPTEKRWTEFPLKNAKAISVHTSCRRGRSIRERRIP